MKYRCKSFRYDDPFLIVKKVVIKKKIMPSNNTSKTKPIKKDYTAEKSKINV
jgi:hypothetical protein